MFPKTPETDDAARAKAVELEQRFNLRCMVVDNPFAVVIIRSERPYTLFLFPPPGEDLDSPSFEERSQACAKECYREMAVGDWDYWVTLGMLDWSSWFNRFLDDPMSFPLKNMAMGANLIGRVIYGQDLMDEAHRQARAAFGDPGILAKWQREAPLRREQKTQALVRMQREQRRVLNAYDRDYLEGFLKAVAERIAAQKVAYIVGVERSGRPLAQAAEWFIPDCPPVRYLDVHCLKYYRVTGLTFAEASAKLQEEFPEIHEALCAAPQSVLFLEDMIGYGGTTHALGSFIEYLSGQAEGLQMMTLSFEPPSWWYRKDVLGVRLVKGVKLLPTPCFRTIPRPTKKSAWFYAKLRRFVEELKSAD